MTGRHHADLIDGGERFRVAPIEYTPDTFPGRHAIPMNNSDRLPIGAVWFSHVSEAWRRRTGRAVWQSVIVATAEQIWHMRRSA